MNQKITSNQILLQIKGFKPFIIVKYCTERDPITRERVFKELQWIEIKPIPEIQITQEHLQLAIDSILENSFDLFSGYDERMEIEYPISFTPDQNLMAIWTKLYPLLDLEYLQEQESYDDIIDYFIQILQDYALEWFTREPHYSEYANIPETEECHCEDYPCCGHSR